jgi:hypothetical protein
MLQAFNPAAAKAKGVKGRTLLRAYKTGDRAFVFYRFQAHGFDELWLPTATQMGGIGSPRIVSPLLLILWSVCSLTVALVDVNRVSRMVGKRPLSRKISTLRNSTRRTSAKPVC